MAQIERPYPLFSAPMFDIWNGYAKQEYSVFVDESFRRFLNMTEVDSKYGYFSYGGVGVPTQEYETLKADLQPIASDYMRLVPGSEIELKHTEFKRIPYREREALAERIAGVLLKRAAFISGFYRPAQSFVMEHVRDAVMEDQEMLPDDTADLYRAAIEEVHQMYYTKGEKSELLSALLTLPVAAWAHMLSSFDCPFRVTYDSRERSEDVSVKDKIDALADIMGRMSPEVRGLYRGFNVNTESHNEPGLQLADLVAGETREFLAAFPEMMSHGATRRIISQESVEDVEAMDVMAIEGAKPFAYKVGAMTKMTKEMQGRFLRRDPKRRTVFHLFAPLLASGIVTCYSTTGTPRHVMPFILGILDQCDR